MKKLLLFILLVYVVQANAQCTVGVSSNRTICIGQSATLTASGATSYTWMPGGLNTTSVSVSPNVTTTYTLTGSTGTCSATKTVTVVVRNPLSFLAVSPGAEKCNGVSVNLNATGSGGDSLFNYTWNPGGLVGQNITVQPNATTQYTVTLTDACGTPPATATVQVTIDPLPTATIDSVMPSCAPLCTTFTASTTNANNYLWNFGGTTSTAINPAKCFTNASVYTVTLTVTSFKGCIGKTTATVVAQNCGGIEKTNNNNLQIDVNPNPSNGVFTIETNVNEKQMVFIFDVNGKLVFNQFINGNATIDARSLNAGVYSLNVVSNQGSTTKKLVVVK